MYHLTLITFLLERFAGVSPSGAWRGVQQRDMSAAAKDVPCWVRLEHNRAAALALLYLKQRKVIKIIKIILR